MILYDLDKIVIEDKEFDLAIQQDGPWHNRIYTAWLIDEPRVIVQCDWKWNIKREIRKVYRILKKLNP